MEHITDNASPPAELKLAWQCKRWNALPEDGNLLGQDYVTMRRMTTLENVYNAVTRIKSLKGKNIHQLTDGERMILRFLMDEGLLFHA